MEKIGSRRCRVDNQFDPHKIWRVKFTLRRLKFVGALNLRLSSLWTLSGLDYHVLLHVRAHVFLTPLRELLLCMVFRTIGPIPMVVCYDVRQSLTGFTVGMIDFQQIQPIVLARIHRLY